MQKLPRARDRQNAASASRRAIVLCVTLWLLARISYFLIADLSLPLKKDTICALTVLQNLPVLLMYVCFMVFHRFLLRIYKIMVKRDTPGRLRCIDIYFWTMMTILLSSQIMSTTTLCVDYDAVLDNSWSEFFMIKSLFIITTVLIEHTIISIIVLPVFYK